MRKRKRIYLPGTPYFITAVGYRRKRIFHEDRSKRLFLETVGTLRRRHQFALHGFVLMPDHYHAIIRPPRGFTISDTVHHIHGVFARMFNLTFAMKGPVFQTGFYDHAIRNMHDYVEKMEYIHSNPVRAGIVDDPVRYAWSSAAHYRETGVALIPIDTIEI